MMATTAPCSMIPGLTTSSTTHPASAHIVAWSLTTPALTAHRFASRPLSFPRWRLSSQSIACSPAAALVAVMSPAPPPQSSTAPRATAQICSASSATSTSAFRPLAALCWTSLSAIFGVPTSLGTIQKSPEALLAASTARGAGPCRMPARRGGGLRRDGLVPQG
jgi:hypothetical protein